LGARAGRGQGLGAQAPGPHHGPLSLLISLQLQLEKHKGEILGVVVVESGWGSILPTVILANMMNGGPAARSGKLSIGDQIMSINGTSLVGLPLATCQGIIKGLKNQTQVKLNIVSCPPVTTVLIKRPDLKYQLGFSVQNGIVSLPSPPQPPPPRMCGPGCRGLARWGGALHPPAPAAASV